MLTLQQQVEKKLCEDEHLFFVRRFFKPRWGFKYTVNWHHVYVSWAIDQVIQGKIKNLVINLPPGGGKTELLMNLIPRGIALNPRSRFLYLSYSKSLVEDVSDTARGIVKSDDFQAMWQATISQSTDAKNSWKTTIDGYDAGHVYAASLGGQITGRRAGSLDDGFYGAILFDDPLKPEDAFSRAAREKTNRRMLNTAASRKAKSSTPMVLIMQRLHLEDPTAFVLQGNLGDRWHHISIPALIDDNYIATLPKHIAKLVPIAERDDQGRQSYWPQKESLEALLQLERGGSDKDGQKVSRYTFASQYMQQPKKLGGDLCKSEWFGRYKDLPELKYRMIFADTAQKTKEHNDYSVFMLVGYGVGGKIYIIDVLRGKWEAPDLNRQAKAFIDRHKGFNEYTKPIRAMKVEDKAAGTQLIQTLGVYSGIIVSDIQRNTDKLMRFMDVAPHIENDYENNPDDRLVMLPIGAPWVSEFIIEVEAFNATMTHDHDDQVDVLIDAVEEATVMMNYQPPRVG